MGEYVPSPSDDVQSRIAALLDGGLRLFLVQRPGPTSFVVSEDTAARAKYKVFLGQRQDCNCHDAVRGSVPCVYHTHPYAAASASRSPTWMLSLLCGAI